MNFDDERLSNYDTTQILSSFYEIYGKDIKTLFFDEIQNLEKWELFANRLQRLNFNIYITGSNSKLLSKELATHLTGRHLMINIFPFSFKEFLSLEGKELTQSEIKTKLFAYLTYGGYPEPLVKKLDHADYLSTLFNSIIYKDIVKRFRIRSVQSLEDLATYLLSNIAKEFSYNALARVTKCKSVHTVEKYLSYLEEAFIFFRVNRFSPKIKEQIAFNKKIYCIDNGFVYAKGFKLSIDIGRLYENTVAIELKKLEMDKLIDLFYWKNPQQEEVDFVIKEGLKIKELIQVCYDLDKAKTKEREVISLLKASKNLKCNNLLVITSNYERGEKIEWFGIKRKIKFMPLWKWLLR